MKNEAIRILQKKNKAILESWMKYQLLDEGLREDLMSNDELRSQSEELLTALTSNLSDTTIEDAKSMGFEQVNDILASVSISRAKQGFSPRETGAYIFSLKN